MIEEKPALGILKRSDWGDTKIYSVECECTDPNHSHDVEIEADDHSVSVHVHVNVIAGYDTRWKYI